MITELHGTARGQIPARLIDLSVGGALLHLSMPLEVGAIHDFALQGSTARWCGCRAR